MKSCGSGSRQEVSGGHQPALDINKSRGQHENNQNLLCPSRFGQFYTQTYYYQPL